MVSVLLVVTGTNCRPPPVKHNNNNSKNCTRSQQAALPAGLALRNAPRGATTSQVQPVHEHVMPAQTSGENSGLAKPNTNLRKSIPPKNQMFPEASAVKEWPYARSCNMDSGIGMSTTTHVCSHWKSGRITHSELL